MSTLDEGVFLPYQSAFAADSAQVRIVEKSRRIGFSWALAGLYALDACTENGKDTWYVGYNKDMAAEFIRDVAWWARRFNAVVSDIGEAKIFENNDPDKGILTYTVRFATGNRITALSSRPTNLRNKRGRIVIDEAAFHDNLRELLKAALAILMWGGTVDIISTHNGVDNYFNQVVEDVRAGRRPYSIHRVTLRDAVDQGFYKRICQMNGWKWSEQAEKEWVDAINQQYGEDAQEELYCVPSKSGGSYLSRYLIEKRMTQGKVYRFDGDKDFSDKPQAQREREMLHWCEVVLQPALSALPPDSPHFFGEDFGRTSDRTVIAPGYIAPNLDRVFPFAIELFNVPYEQQGQVLFYMIDRLPHFSHGALDGTGNGGYLAEVACQRYSRARISLVNISEKWYLDNCPPFKAAFEAATIELPKDRDHLIDLTHIKRINGVPKIPKTRTTSTDKTAPKRHGDAAVAYIMGYYAAAKPIPVYDYQGIAHRSRLQEEEQNDFSTSRKKGLL